MAKLHRRRESEKTTWCGRPIRSVHLVKRTTPAEDVCRACEVVAGAKDAEIQRLALLIDEAYSLWLKERRK